VIAGIVIVSPSTQVAGRSSGILGKVDAGSGFCALAKRERSDQVDGPSDRRVELGDEIDEHVGEGRVVVGEIHTPAPPEVEFMPMRATRNCCLSLHGTTHDCTLFLIDVAGPQSDHHMSGGEEV
jgi:hypothetical protein